MASVTQAMQGRAPVHGNVLGPVALDFVLRIGGAGVVCVTLPVEGLAVRGDDAAADMPGLRIPAHVIAHLECVCHRALLSLRYPASLSAAANKTLNAGVGSG